LEKREGIEDSKAGCGRKHGRRGHAVIVQIVMGAIQSVYINVDIDMGMKCMDLALVLIVETRMSH
jgi:hypothetical protein